MQEVPERKDKPDWQNIKKPPARREKKPPKKITARYLHNAGLAYLERFPAGTAHFRRVMTRKIDRSCRAHADQDRAACITLLDGTVAEFTRMGLLNDDAYLQGMVTSLRRRGASAQAIAARLAVKGIKQDLVSAMLQKIDADTGAQQPEMVAALLLSRRKKFGPFRIKADTDKNKELAALARAGFGFDIAQKALGLPLEDAEDILYQSRI